MRFKSWNNSRKSKFRKTRCPGSQSRSCFRIRLCTRKDSAFALRVHEFWYDGRRHCGSESVRPGMGRSGQTKIVQLAWHDVDQLALCRFYRAQEQSIGACAGRWQMGAKVQTRSRCAIADGWGEFFG